MHGMFRANGGCGYVKKPDFLMRSGHKNEVFNPKAKLPAKTSLKVNILKKNVYVICLIHNMSSNNVVCYLTGESLHGRWMAFGF